MAAKNIIPKLVNSWTSKAIVLRLSTAKNISTLNMTKAKCGMPWVISSQNQRFYSTEKQQETTSSTAAPTMATADKINVASQQTTNVETNVAEEIDVKTLVSTIENMKEELAAEKEKYNEILDKYKRSLADSENMRVRLNKQISDAKMFGIQGFCKDLLEVADTLGHAMEAVPKDKLNDNIDLKNLYDGLCMTKASLLQVFKRHGLKPIDPLNEKFNPNVHEALFQKEDKNVEPNTIVEVTKLGYKLHERCIRPALVGVSKC